jgi:hypothetical protein
VHAFPRVGFQNLFSHSHRICRCTLKSQLEHSGPTGATSDLLIAIVVNQIVWYKVNPMVDLVPMFDDLCTPRADVALWGQKYHYCTSSAPAVNADNVLLANQNTIGFILAALKRESNSGYALPLARLIVLDEKILLGGHNSFFSCTSKHIAACFAKYHTHASAKNRPSYLVSAYTCKHMRSVIHCGGSYPELRARCRVLEL